MRRIFTLFIASFIVLMGQAQQSQGLNTSDVWVGNVANGGATQDWTSVNQAELEDGIAATVFLGRQQSSRYFKLTDFDFNIPTNATITGIAVTMKSRYTENSGFEGSVRLVNGEGAITAFQKTFGGSNLNNSFTNTTFGSSSDLWSSGFTAATINDVDFGVAIEVHRPNNGNVTTNFFIDVVSITVYYTAPLALTDPQIFIPTSLTATVAEDLTGTDPNGGTLTANLVAGPDPALGTFEFNTNGNFSFTPAPITTFPGGPVTFTYNVTSTVGGTSNTAMVILEYPDNANLPVNFISFNAKKVSGGTQLTWDVADEHDVARYEVEKNSGNGFQKIGEVAATKSSSYSFVDAQASTGTVQYRVRNVDIDGQFKYTNIISFKNGVSSVVLRAFPLPAGNSITVQHATAGNGRITLAAANGQIVKTIVPEKGAIQTEINLGALKAGMYLLRFDAGNGKLETLKIIKQ